MNAQAILDREYLDMRSKLISLAASLDRIDRGGSPSAIKGDDRIALIQRAILALAEGRSDRAEQLQRLFSDEYRATWMTEFGFESTLQSRQTK